jgi:hypothetical protein
MGSSKSYRGGPGFQEQNTPRGKTKVSKGSVVKPEGTATSSKTMREGVKSTAGKSKSSHGPAKNAGPYGRS